MSARKAQRQPKATPKPTKPKGVIVTGGFPADLDTANIELLQASALLDVLAVLAEQTGTDIPDTCYGNLAHSLYAIKSEVDRAKEALFGKEGP